MTKRTKTTKFYTEARDGKWYYVSSHREMGPAMRSREKFLREFTEYPPASVRVVRVEVTTEVTRVDTGRKVKP